MWYVEHYPRGPRPRALGVDGHELGLPSWREWSARDPLEARALEQMVLGVSTRRYARSLEPLPERVEVRGVSKSVVSERFVYGTERKLAELMSRELSDLALVALMIDGVHFAEHVVLAVVGVDEHGDKHVLDCARVRLRMSRWCVPLSVMRGDASKALIWENAELTEATCEGNDKEIWLYFLTDHDPRGDAIIESAMKRLLRYVRLDPTRIHHEKLAVTPAQIKKFRLPTRPTKFAGAGLVNRAKFEQGSVEIDALPPNELRHQQLRVTSACWR